jgi:hypothetical protein
VIQSDIEDPLSEELLKVEFSPGDLVTIDVEDGNIRTHVVPGPPPPPGELAEAEEQPPAAVEPAGAGAAGPSGGDGGGPV